MGGFTTGEFPKEIEALMRARDFLQELLVEHSDESNMEHFTTIMQQLDKTIIELCWRNV
jgi:hypothetical protein